MIPPCQTLFGNAVRETPFRLFRVGRPRAEAKQSFAKGVPNRVWEPGQLRAIIYDLEFTGRDETRRRRLVGS
jgi:hypothetical protein